MTGKWCCLCRPDGSDRQTYQIDYVNNDVTKSVLKLRHAFAIDALLLFMFSQPNIPSSSSRLRPRLTSNITNMSFLRIAKQPLLRTAAPRQTPTLTFASRRAAHQDYGSGTGDPAGENPQQQGKNPSEPNEHPGPEPPSAGKKGQQGSQQQQQQQQQPSKGSSSNSKGTQGAQPKILADSPPSEGGNAPGEVQQHNKEMNQRAEQAAEKVRDEDIEKDKVPKGFWAGE